MANKIAAILDFTLTSDLLKKIRKLKTVFTRVVKYDIVKHFSVLIAFYIYIFSLKGEYTHFLLRPKVNIYE